MTGAMNGRFASTTSRTTRNLFIAVGFQLVWLSAAFGAAHGSALIGTLTALVFIAAVVASSTSATSVLAISTVSAMTGLVVETGLLAAGLVHYEASWPSHAVAPVWIVALWFGFGATISPLVALTGRDRWIRLVMLGALAGPAAYWAGARISALQVEDPGWPAYLTIAIIWGIVLPVLAALDGRLRRRQAAPT